MSGLGVQLPSGSTNGRMVQVTQTATLGDLLHTAVAGTTNWDSITVYACNNDTSDRDITIEYGGVGAANNIVKTLPAKGGMYLLLAAFRLQNGLAVRAFASVANVVNCYVEVDRVTV